MDRSGIYGKKDNISIDNKRGDVIMAVRKYDIGYMKTNRQGLNYTVIE